MTKTYYTRDTSAATGAHNASNEFLLDTTAGAGETAGSGNIGSGSDSLAFCFTTGSGEPGSADWPAGTYEVNLDCSDAGGNISYGLLTLGGSAGHFGRVDSGLTADQETAVQAESAFTGTGVKNATLSRDWAAGDAGDRFECLVAGLNSASMNSPQTFTLTFDSDGSASGPWAVATQWPITAIENLVQTDSGSKAVDLGRMASETMILSEAVARIADAYRDQQESLELSDAASRIADAYRLAVELLDLTTSASRVADAYRLIAETLAIANATPSTLERVQRPLSMEGLVTTDLAQRVADAYRAAVETLVLTDLASISVPQAGSWPILAIESLVHQESASRIAHVNRLGSDQLELQTSAARLSNALRLVAEQLVLPDSAQRIADANRSQSEDLVLASSAGRGVQLHWLISETLVLLTAENRLVTANRLAQELLVQPDSAQRLAHANRLSAEQLGLAPNSNRIADAFRSITDQLELVTTSQRLADAYRAVMETLAFVDLFTLSIAGSGTIPITAIESLAFDSVAQRLADALRLASDSASLVDSASRVADALRTQSEQLQLVDASARIASALRLASETLVATDSFATALIAGIGILVVESMEMSDSADRISDALRSPLETLGITAAGSRLADASRLASESMSLLDLFYLWTGINLPVPIVFKFSPEYTEVQSVWKLSP